MVKARVEKDRAGREAGREPVNEVEEKAGVENKVDKAVAGEGGAWVSPAEDLATALPQSQYSLPRLSSYSPPAMEPLGWLFQQLILGVSMPSSHRYLLVHPI